MELTREDLRKELAQAVRSHIQLLKEVEEISEENMEGFTFMMRSFGFMLDRSAMVLYHEKDEEDLYFMMFQYYSLLTELKYNLLMNYSDTTLNGRTLLEIVSAFPTTYEKELKNWWESKTGLDVEETKQTIKVPAFQK